MPASISVSRSKPTPVTVVPSNPAPRRRNESGFWSITETVCPCSSRPCASDEPTRPQPMITKCTNADLPSGYRTRDARNATRLRARREACLAWSLVLTFADAVKRLLVGRPVRSDLSLLYTSDAADDLLCVDLGGRRII